MTLVVTSAGFIAVAYSLAQLIGFLYVNATGNHSIWKVDPVDWHYLLRQAPGVSALADFNGLPGGGAAPTCRTDADDTFADFSSDDRPWAGLSSAGGH